MGGELRVPTGPISYEFLQRTVEDLERLKKHTNISQEVKILVAGAALE